VLESVLHRCEVFQDVRIANAIAKRNRKDPTANASSEAATFSNFICDVCTVAHNEKSQ